MASATLLDHNIQIDRTQIVPTQQDEFSKQWAVQVAQQQVRAAGFCGSVVMSLPSGQWNFSVTSPVITLPAWFNGTRPPMIWAMPQYGSVVLYKQFQDSRNIYTDGVSPVFRTYVTYLQFTAGQWQFQIKHDVSSQPFGIRPNWIRDIGLSRQWLPNFTGADEPIHTKIVLHYYCLGVDPELG